MAANTTISISYKLEESGDGFNKAIIKAEDLHEALKSAVKQVDQLKSPMINFAALATSIDSVNNSLRSLQNTFKGLTDAYAAQVEVETQLATTMRNTMGACESDIQSIKDLCSAQQELGIIGDEVQLAGAQELATYLSEKQSLEKLIPVMNDMLAQQYGLNATQENATQIATMLGKVMDGQTGALSRYGYSFDEVQEKILKYGTEAERAAVLCEVVESSVGGMNAELAKTDAGKLKQTENRIGNIKEKLGGLVQGAMPFITIAANATIALAGLVKFTAGIKAAAAAVKGLKLGQSLTNIVIKTTGLYSKNTALGLEMLRTSARGAEKAAFRLRIALHGLLMVSAVGAVIWAVTKAIQALSGSSKDASERQKELAEEQARLRKETEEWKNGLTNISQSVSENAAKEMSALERLYGVAKDDTKSRKERADAISELKRQWPDYFSQISAERIEMNKLTKSYEDAKNAILDLATVKAIEGKLIENAGEKLNLGMEFDDLIKENKEFEEIFEAVKNLPKVDSPTGGVRFSDVKKALEGKKYKGEDAFLALQTGKFNANGVSVLQAHDVQGGQQFINLPEAMTAMRDLYTNMFMDIADKADAIDNANDELIAKRAAASDRLKGRIGNPDSPQPTQHIYRENATELWEVEENVKFYQSQLEHATKETAPNINANIDLWQNLADAIRNAGKETKKIVQEWHEVPSTVNEIRENIAILQSQLEATDINDTDTITKINAQINAYHKQIDAVHKLGAEAERAEDKFTWHEAPKTLQDINDNIAKLQNDLLGATSIEEAAGINRQIAAFEKLGNAYREAGKHGKSTFETLRDGYGDIKSIGSGIEGITQAIEGNGNAWQTLTSIVDGFLQIYDGIKAIVDIINMMTAATGILTTGKTEEAAATVVSAGAQGAEAVAAEANAAAQAPVVAANKVAAASFMELAAAAFYAAHAYIPFAGFGIATGFITAAKSIVTGIGATPFANGGIVSGPTVGLIGEYAGASHNPEVVAPLDKLRSMLNEGRAEAAPGRVEFEIRGDRLYGVLRRHERMLDRT